MKTTQNTILITGGSAGIGFEIARLFSEKGNEVIITGRNEQRLQEAAGKLKNVTGIVSDVSNEADVKALVERLRKDFPKLNIIINNAGRAFAYTLDASTNAAAKAAEEIQTNYISVVNLTEQLLPLLETQKEAAIVNVTSIVAFAPGQQAPTYSASKAALHSYTRSMRYALAKSNIKVFELMPPLVNTEFSKEIGGSKGIAPALVAEDLIAAFEKDNYEIHVGVTADIYKLYLSSPEQALQTLNATR